MAAGIAGGAASAGILAEGVDAGAGFLLAAAGAAAAAVLARVRRETIV